MAEENPKIIVDEDWKSQVEKEKQAYAEHAEIPTTGGSADQVGDDPEMPPASYAMLVSMLASDAMIALGQIPNPITGEFVPRRNTAKYLIDTIAMLHEKTRGNVAPEESQQVEELLHQLRMEFVRMPTHRGTTPSSQPQP